MKPSIDSSSALPAFPRAESSLRREPPDHVNASEGNVTIIEVTSGFEFLLRPERAIIISQYPLRGHGME